MQTGLIHLHVPALEVIQAAKEMIDKIAIYLW